MFHKSYMLGMKSDKLSSCPPWTCRQLGGGAASSWGCLLAQSSVGSEPLELNFALGDQCSRVYSRKWRLFLCSCGGTRFSGLCLYFLLHRFSGSGQPRTCVLCPDQHLQHQTHLVATHGLLRLMIVKA